MRTSCTTVVLKSYGFRAGAAKVYFLFYTCTEKLRMVSLVGSVLLCRTSLSHLLSSWILVTFGVGPFFVVNKTVWVFVLADPLSSWGTKFDPKAGRVWWVPCLSVGFICP